MRLLDHIAQYRHPMVVRRDCGEVWHLPGPSDYARQLARCPLRYVLADELVRVCVELAYSEGDELSSCLDLVRFPAEQLWVEWSESVLLRELLRALPESPVATIECVRGGLWITSDSSGRTAAIRTFWLSGAEPREPMLSAVETIIDLDHAPHCAERATMLLEGAVVRVHEPLNQQLDMLLHCAGFRLDPVWCRYYSRAVSSDAMREPVIVRLLSGVAFDVPWVLALFMLMQLKAGLMHRVVSPTRLNAKRARLGRCALLEHVEVSCPLLSAAPQPTTAVPDSPRQGPRLHHVRGHLVRREEAIFWRRPHWRGHVRLGSVRSRTVNLRLF